jgi:hypothetical protein
MGRSLSPRARRCPALIISLAFRLFELGDPEIVDTYSTDRTAKKFGIDADHESAYLVERSDRCNADEVSRRILEPIFFPGPEGGFMAERII